MKKVKIFILLLFISGFISCSASNLSDNPESFQVYSGEYFGQTPAGDEPQLFAPGIISTPLYTRDITMMPDGNEIYFSISSFGYNLIFYTKQENGKWTEPKPANFISDFDFLYYEPHITHDGKKMFFLSNLVDDDSVKNDQDIWVVDRVGDTWGNPYNLGAPINTDGAEYFPSVTKNGTLYFTRAEKGTRIHFIYRSKLIDGKYTEPEKLGPEVNCGTNRYNAYIDTEERFIILPAVGVNDSFGGENYYIVFRDENDDWSEPINMGNKINSNLTRGHSASLSPDGKYLFFMSSRGNPDIDFNKKLPSFSEILNAFNNPQNGNSDIYWISTKFINELKLVHLK